MDPAAELVLDRVKTISRVLDEAMAGAMLQAERRAAGFDHARFPHTRPLTIRQDVRLALEATGLPAGWHIEGDPRKMGQLLLIDGVTGMTLRFLKAPYSQPDRIPHAGRNPARQKSWTGRTLQRALPDFGDPGRLTGAVSLAGETFLILWAYRDATRRLEEGYDLRVVHTRAPGAFGKSTPCDLDLTIPRGGLLREEDLRFVGSDEEEELFAFDIPAEDEETGLA